MKKLFSIALLFLLSSVTFAENMDEILTLANNVFASNPDSSYQICMDLEEKLKKEKGNKLLLSQVQLSQVKYLVLKTRFDEASKILNELIPVFKSHNQPSLLANCYSLKSVIAHKIKEKEKAIEFNLIAYDLYQKSNNTDGIFKILSNLSMDYIDYEMYDSAYTTLNRLFSYETKMSPSNKYYMYQNFGIYYNETHDYKNAIFNYLKALEFAEKERMVDSKATLLMLLSKPYLSQKNYVSAFQYIKQSIEVSKQHNLIYELNEAYDQLVLAYELTGDFKKAYQTKIINDSIEDEIYNIEKINRINQFETQLKLTEKEKVITQQKLTIKQEQLEHAEAKSQITSLAFIIIVCLLLIVLVSIIFIRAKKLNRVINAQKAEVENQKLIVEEKNREITASISYAKRIQTAILPPQSLINQVLPQNFIFYLPKDIVAGDFYWTHQTENTILFAVADCTGHGVPGSLVSVVCHNALNRAIGEFKLTQPAPILDAVSDMVIETFEKSETDVKDGMDIALCSLKYNVESEMLPNTHDPIPNTVATLQYAGANNALYIIRNNILIETKADKQPVGKYAKKQPFTNHTIELEKDDLIYLFSDGFADQFGGEKGKKFMYKAFKEMLVKFNHLPLDEQKDAIKSIFYKWKEENEQVDDICIMGVRI